MNRTKLMVCLSAFAVMASTFFMAVESSAQSSIHIGQFYARGAYARANSDREDDLFAGGVPVLGLNGISDRDGWNIATGIDVMIAPKDPFFGQELLGEVGLEFSRFGDGDRAQNVPATIAGGLGAVADNTPPAGRHPLAGAFAPNSIAEKGSPQSEIATTIFNVHMGPKLRFNFGAPSEKLLDINRFHPYLGAAMMYGVISPPSDDVTYLDIGAMVWVGFDYELPLFGGLFSLGSDYRHHFYSNQTGGDIDYGSAGIFLGINW